MRKGTVSFELKQAHADLARPVVANRRIAALRDRSCLKTLVAYYLSLSKNIYPESYLNLGMLLMLSYA